MTRTLIALTVCCSLLFLSLSSRSRGAENTDDFDLWEISKHGEKDGSLTLQAKMMDIKNPSSAKENPSQNPDDDGYEFDLTTPARLILSNATDTPIGTTYTIRYYRGPICKAPDSLSPLVGYGAHNTNLVSIF